ncbi:MAG: hypothetical protein AB7O78_18770 [Thermoleophilia bacterium]
MAEPPDTSNLVRPLTTERRSLFAKAFSDREGNLRTGLLLSLLMAVIVVLSLGTFAALLAANLGSPETLAMWVIGAFFVIKVPLLIVCWWIIARRHDPAGGGGWESKECRQILDYLETQAAAAEGRPDAASRLSYFAREAWFVADRAADADKGAAVETAVRIEGMAAAAGVRVGRTALPPDPTGE